MDAPTQPFVIIGGDAAGMSAASKIKREAKDAEVIVFERSPYISYSACGMPYWIGGVLESDRQLIVLTPEVARRRRGIDVRTHHEVTAIDLASKLVMGTDRATGTPFSQPFGTLLIATGARASRPPLPGMDLPGVFTLRSLVDAQRIYAYMAEHEVKQAVVVGGGSIGVEMAEALWEREAHVTVLELLPQLMPNLDADMAQPPTEHMREKGVDVQTGVRVTQFRQADGRLWVDTEQTEPLPADLILVAVGVRPNAELAKDAGLRIGETGAIWVDRTMRTSHPAVFAAGDCAEHNHIVTGRNAWIPLATSANKGGRIAGENMLGNAVEMPGILGTAVVKVFDYTVANTGLTETAARASGLFGKDGEFVGSVVIENADKAGYWPGAEMMKVKLVFDKRGGRVVGGQLAGKAGVNKRIDIVATAITARMTLEDIALLDLSYAPPYSPTYDPIQIAANVGQRDLLPVRQPVA